MISNIIKTRKTMQDMIEVFSHVAGETIYNPDSQKPSYIVQVTREGRKHTSYMPIGALWQLVALDMPLKINGV